MDSIDLSDSTLEDSGASLRHPGSKRSRCRLLSCFPGRWRSHRWSAPPTRHDVHHAALRWRGAPPCSRRASPGSVPGCSLPWLTQPVLWPYTRRWQCSGVPCSHSRVGRWSRRTRSPANPWLPGVVHDRRCQTIDDRAINALDAHIVTARGGVPELGGEADLGCVEADTGTRHHATRHRHALRGHAWCHELDSRRVLAWCQGRGPGAELQRSGERGLVELGVSQPSGCPPA